MKLLRSMPANALVLVSVLALPGASIPPVVETHTWYDFGHRLVARIAALRLTPNTTRAVQDLLGGQEMGDASLWADQIRGTRRETGPLHFVNIPLEADGYVAERDCPDGRCIIAAIESDRQILADSTVSFPERVEALKFLIHFIADLHQPLHVSDHGDRGGNDRQVVFFGNPMNLHQVWDGELLKITGIGESEYFERLRREMGSVDLASLEPGSVVDWAMEGHRVARDYAYRLPPSGRISDKYLEANLPVVDLALIKAGVRLAKVLNDALDTYHAVGPPPPAPGAHVYSDREAAAHVGEKATVVGTVVSVHRSQAGNIFLNFGADYPHQTFSGAVLNPRGTWQQSLDTLTGKRVGVRGLIKLYRGQVEIVIESGEQIVAGQ